MSNRPQVCEIVIGQEPTYRDMTDEEMAQREIDAAESAANERRQRAIVSADRFRAKFTAEEQRLMRQSPDDEVQEARELVLSNRTGIDLLSPAANYYVRNVMGAKGMPDGSAILSAERVEEILNPDWTPA